MVEREGMGEGSEGEGGREKRRVREGERKEMMRKEGE